MGLGDSGDRNKTRREHKGRMRDRQEGNRVGSNDKDGDKARGQAWMEGHPAGGPGRVKLKEGLRPTRWTLIYTSRG